MSAPLVSGQWVGNFVGQTDGFALLNIENGAAHTPFVCITQDLGQSQPTALRVVFDAVYDGSQFKGISRQISVYSPETNTLVDVHEFSKRTGDNTISEQVVIEGKFSTYRITGRWSSDKVGNGTFDLRNPAVCLVEPPDHILTWDEYVDFVTAPNRNLVFRGQASNQWRLRTSFHRLGRYDLGRYWRDICPVLCERLRAANVLFDLTNPEDIGGLLCFAQHHGFPTPLLDWTSNPFVAAYFAFDRNPRVVSANNSCRVYVLDYEAWSRDTNNAASLADPNPLVSLRTFSSDKVIRQKLQNCVHTFANVEDINAWVRVVEQKRGAKYLTTIDIPWTEIPKGRAALRARGIRADTLFDGHDALCKALRDDLMKIDE